jgi:hypothetical protein
MMGAMIPQERGIKGDPNGNPCHLLDLMCHYQIILPLNYVGPRPSFGKTWSYLSHFWTSTCWSKKECPGEVEIVDLTHFLGLCGPSKGSSRVL